MRRIIDSPSWEGVASRARRDLRWITHRFHGQQCTNYWHIYIQCSPCICIGSDNWEDVEHSSEFGDVAAGNTGLILIDVGSSV